MHLFHLIARPDAAATVRSTHRRLGPDGDNHVSDAGYHWLEELNQFRERCPRWRFLESGGGPPQPNACAFAVRPDERPLVSLVRAVARFAHNQCGSGCAQETPREPTGRSSEKLSQYRTVL